jgi:hypothetical protein
MKKLVTLWLIIMVLVLSSCTTADVVSSNISKDADHFKVQRRIVFYNSIKDVYILEITGNCSINVDSADNQLEVTCKIGPNQYQKHFLGLSDNVTYTVEQIEFSDVSPYKYKIVFKPESIMPIEIDTETGE